jgi:hypothetical protein
LVPVADSAPVDEEGFGSYVQGWLVFRQSEGDRKLKRLAMSATESIQVALAENLPMMADSELLQLNMSQFMDEIDEFSKSHREETAEFRSFVDKVTASDFARFYETMSDPKDGEEES